MHEVIWVEGLHKTYGAVKAVDGVDLIVEEGEIFGMVGPNGAGKTTTIECIEGLRTPDSGKITVLGMDPQKQSSDLYELIGMQLQGSSLYPHIKVGEALELFSSFYSHPAPKDELLERLGLSEKENVYFSKLSGGQKQRLFICLALINKPQLVFFDELTTGLDPQARRATWDLVRGVREQGHTVFLTTHFMDEAENLCDRVAVMDHGKIVALGKPSDLIEQYAHETRIRLPQSLKEETDWLSAIRGVISVEIGEDFTLINFNNENIVELLQLLDQHGISLKGLHIQQSSLEDVFLSLTGNEMRD
ncbi:MAG: ABC transporter ATP-binding protein [Anaerolineaceae bacterium]|nr:ABC transporter ATP-binding protein [Anaerolineaceae bacterium]